MHVLDASDIVDGVDPNAAAEWLSVNVADQVSFVSRRIDSVERVEQFDVQHGWVLAPHGNGPRVRFGHGVDFLPGIINDHTPQDTVGVERQKSWPVFLVIAFGYEKSGPVVGRLGQSPVANAVVGRY